jgi:hypothetical protein
MSEGHEIDFQVLLDRSIRDFRPTKPLWPVGSRLALWILLGTAILAICAGLEIHTNLLDLNQNPGRFVPLTALILVSIGAAFLALRSAIPGREVSRAELLAIFAPLGVLVATSFEHSLGPVPRELIVTGLPVARRVIGLAALPWVALFWAVWRGVPLHPAKTGGLVGVAGFCFALAAYGFVSNSSGLTSPVIWLMLLGMTALSAVAGVLWLDPVRRWQGEQSSIVAPIGNRPFLRAGAVFPAAVGVSVMALILVLKGVGGNLARIPDFDLAIESYERSLSGFHPNVPSSSIDTVLTAYVEHGMPAYMWDFGGEGFKLAGGRFERLPDGTPVTFTWFRGRQDGIMCIFRQTSSFNPPSAHHEEHHHLLFYRYRGFSLCLINVGGYGRFISVIASRLPMKQFVPLVLASAS